MNTHNPWKTRSKWYITSILVWVLLAIGWWYLLHIQSMATESNVTSWRSELWERLFDDSALPIPPARTMSTLDTTEIDFKLEGLFIDILSNADEYMNVSDLEYGTRMREICTYYDDICAKIKFSHPFTMRQNYMYTVFVVYLVSQIDQNIQLPGTPPLRTVLSSIRFDLNTYEPRGKAGYRNIIMNVNEVRNPAELFEVITHEFGHVFDLWVLQDLESEQQSEAYINFGNKTFGVNDFSLEFYKHSRESTKIPRKSARNSNVVSWYAKTNVFEEFAELFNAWINHQVPLLDISRNDPVMLKKYLLMQEVFGKRYINKDIDTFKEMDIKDRPWDTTRRNG